MSGNNNIPISRTEIEQCQEAVKNFRVQELHQLVASFKYPKIGKKTELVSRALSILINPKYQVSAVQKVQEIQASNRIRDTSQPYPTQAERTVNGTMPNNPIQSPPPSQHGMYGMQAAAAAAANMPQFPGGFGNFMNYAAMAASYNHFSGAPQQYHHQPNQNFGHPLPVPHVVPVQHSAGGLVTNLRIVELPFYDHIKVIVPMTELPSYPVPTRPGEGRFSCTFGVSSEDIPKLSYHEDLKFPRFELQLRVFLLEPSEEQPDAFPPGSAVKLDEIPVNLPAIIPTNKPNAEQKRYSRPVNITPYCRPARSRDRPHRLNFEWNGDRRSWAFTVLLVRRVNSDMLLERIRKDSKALRPASKTKDTIIRRLNGADEDDVQMDTLKISLVDPLGRMRIKIPARAVDCTHLQTFDLYNYLMMNEKRPGWKCPVCDKNAIYSKLIIDEYFEQMIKSVGSSVEEVELLKDGTYGQKRASETIALESEGETEMVGDDEDIMIVEKPPKGVAEKKKPSAAPKTTSETTSTKEHPNRPGQKQQEPSSRTSAASTSARDKRVDDDDDIIELSSDEEGEDLATAISASNMMTDGSSATGTPSSNVSGGAGREGGGGTMTTTLGQSSQRGVGTSRGEAPATSAGGSNARGLRTDSRHHQQQQQQNGYSGINNNKNSGSGSFNPSVISSSPPQLLHVNNNNNVSSGGGGKQPALFRPTMDDLAKSHVAQNLAMFLQNIYAKNNRQPHQQPQQQFLRNSSSANI